MHLQNQLTIIKRSAHALLHHHHLVHVPHLLHHLHLHHHPHVPVLLLLLHHQLLHVEELELLLWGLLLWLELQVQVVVQLHQLHQSPVPLVHQVCPDHQEEQDFQDQQDHQDL